MYNIDKRKEFIQPTVAEVIESLQELPQDMTVCFCGAPAGYLHVDGKENICSFDHNDLSEEYFTPKNLQMGDFVVLGDGCVYQVQPNNLAKTGLSLFSSTYSCLVHLDAYDDNFNTTKEFNIHKIICLDGKDEDSYKVVGQHFISRIPLSKVTMECINWDWEREEAAQDLN